jgi:uncharacterized membrane protein YhhN
VQNRVLPGQVSWPLLGFWACTAVHLVLVAVDLEPYNAVTKALLMPLLTLWAAASGASKGLLAALLFSWGGDVLLSIDGLFIPGMVLFGAAQVSYVSCFVRRGALRELRSRPVIPALYLLTWAAAMALLWPGLGDMRLPVAAYSLLLFASALTASGLNRWAAAGGLLFLLSDGLIGVELGDLSVLPLHGVVVMATYATAQYLLAHGLLHADARDTARRPAVSSG